MEVGWIVDADRAGFIWDAPTRLRTEAAEGLRHAKSVAACPAVIDFEAVTRAADTPTKIRADFDSGDHLHPNDAGYQAMANAIDLALFQSGAVRKTATK